MLALRLVRGASPAAILRRLLLACATAGVGFLLLAELSHALAHPSRRGEATVGLLWCLLPLTATVQLAAAVARTEQGGRTRSGLAAAGIGAARLPALIASSTAVSCLLGSGLALLLHLHLRGGLRSLPYGGSAAELLAADRPFPSAAALTLLCLPPAAAAAGAAFATRPRPFPRPDSGSAFGAGSLPRSAAGAETVPYLAGLLWGVAALAAGLSAEVYAGRSATGARAVLVGVVGGWVLIVLGLAVMAPGLAQLCGRLLVSWRPGALRLLAGRALQGEARSVGQPLGLVCGVVAGAVAAAEVHGSLPAALGRISGPLTALGAGLVVYCIVASALTALVEARSGRAPANAALFRLGVPRRTLRRAFAVRALLFLGLLAALAWGVGVLAALPFR